ncbi:MAG TPA: glycosyltransferase [Pseudonocardiaceae bacterium]|jgi:glycosyltransferase involved in cell wall biosynthesis/O-antigen/teichoic acid export membrane protein|nr:glycosyltransferase [Pseudonocardiaceae bacterium]
MVETAPPLAETLAVSVVIPARNAERWLPSCLESVLAQRPREVIVVDGRSTDRTVEIALAAGARVISDDGRGLPIARTRGLQEATCEVVALIDSDVLLPDGSLANLLREFDHGEYDGLQFGLVNEADGDGYWGKALAWHTNHGRVRYWFGVCATLVRRPMLLDFGFDEQFVSGEDIDLRVRLRAAGHKIGVSSTSIVRHRFDDSFDAAKDQWVADGAGLARTARKHPRRAGWVLALPLLAALRGFGLAALTAPRFLPYWLGFVTYNYRSMIRELLNPGKGGLSLGGNATALAAARVVPMMVGFAFWALAALRLSPTEVGLGSVVASAVMLAVQLALLGVGPATVTLLPRQADGGKRLVATGLLTVTLSALVVAGGMVLVTHALGDGLARAWQGPVIVAFVVAALCATLAYQLDHVAIARSRTDRALTRSFLQGVVQLGVLAAWLVTGSATMLAVVVAIFAGAAASVLLGLGQLRRHGPRPDWRRGTRPGEAVRLLRTGLPNHLLVLADRAPGYLLPLVVASRLSPAAAAAWYMVWMLTAAVYFVPQSAGYSLQAKLSADPTAAPRALAWRALRLSLVLTVLAGALLVVIGPALLHVLGRGYASAGSLLPVLAGALLFACVSQVYYGVCRAYGRLGEASAVALLAAVIAVAPAALIAGQHNLGGLSWLWLAGQATAGLLGGFRLRALVSAKTVR